MCRTVQSRPEGETVIVLEELVLFISSALASNSSANARSLGSTS